MTCALLVLCIWLGMMLPVRCFFDTSYYKVLFDDLGGNATYWESKCKGEPNFKFTKHLHFKIIQLLNFKI